MTAPRSTARPAAPRDNAPRGNVVRQARGTSSKRGFYIALLLVVVVGAFAISRALQNGRAASAPIVVPPAPVAGVQAPGYTLGNANAPVEIVEFADFECPVCGQFATVTEPDVRQRLVNAGLARYRIYDFQVTPAHRNSPAASLAAACADEQGKFWPMHDRIFEGQTEWNSEATGDPRPVLAGYAQQLGLDVTRWGQCYDQRKYVSRIAAHAAAAQRAGIHGTPNFVIGDRLYANTMSFDEIKAAVDSARARGAGAKPVAMR